MFKINCLILLLILVTINCVSFRKTGKIYDRAGLNKVVVHNSTDDSSDAYIELFNDSKKILFKETENFSHVTILRKYKKILLLSNLNNPDKTHLLVITFDGYEVLKKILNAELLRNYTDHGITIDSAIIKWYDEKIKVSVSEINDTFKISIKTPKNDYITFCKIRDTAQKKGIGIGYGKNFNGLNSYSSIDSLMSDTLKNKKMIKGGASKGVRSNKSTQQSLMHIMASIRYAYNKRLKERPDLQGKIVLKFKITGTGDVISCKVIEATLTDEQLQKNVINRIVKCKFDTIDPVTDTTEVVYPFVFSRDYHSGK